MVHDPTQIPDHENKFNRLMIEFVAFVIVFLAIWVPRSRELDRFATPDEHLWLTRSVNFYKALEQRDFGSTYQVYHPGVTVMWTGSLSFLARLAEYRRVSGGEFSPDDYDKYTAKTRRIDKLATARYFIVLAHTGTLLLAYLYLRGLIGFLPTVTAFLLIAFNPLHIALSRVLHLDTLLANLLLLSLLGFLSYLAGGKSRDLIISGAAAGLSWLTKSAAFLIIPVVIILMGISANKSFSTGGDRYLKRRIKLFFYPLLLWGMVGLFVFVLFWPALWVNPLKSISDIFNWVIDEAVSGHDVAVFFNGQVFPDGNIGIGHFYFYPLTFLWRSTPIVLLGLVLSIIGYLKHWPLLDKKKVKLTILGLCIFVSIFIFSITLIGKKFDRYLLPVYAPMDIIAALGWVSLIYWIRGKKLPRYLSISAPIILIIAIGIQIMLAVGTAPYYFSYYNPLMGGSKKAPEVMMIGWGEGIDQAARYLNEKDDAEKLNVISSFSWCSFSCFFNGQVRNLPDENIAKDSQDWEDFISSDYMVIYIQNWQIQTPKIILDYIQNLKPEHTVWIDGIEYVRIYIIH